jgi:hypothetical protein
MIVVVPPKAAARVPVKKSSELSVPPIEDKEPATTSQIRRVLLQFARGSADRKLFTSAAQAEVFPVRARQITEKLNSLSIPAAVIYTNELVGRRDENGLRVYRYFLNDVTRTLSCTVKLTKDGKITDLRLEEISN